MSSKHNIAKNVLDASFNKICTCIKWKCSILGKYYYQIDKYFPSSKKCSHCGVLTDKTKNLGQENVYAKLVVAKMIEASMQV